MTRSARHADEEQGDSGLADLLAEVRRIDVQSKRLVTDLMAGGYASVFRGGGLEFDTVREYVEGDDPRSVDWNVTARMGRPYVKTYVEERERTVLFLLDLSPTMDGGFGAWSARETATRVCACLALAADRCGDKVGLVAFGDRVESWVAPARGAGHALRIVRDLLVLRGRGGPSDPAAALGFLARTVRRRAIVFLVSDLLHGTGGGALAPAARRHDLVAMRLLAPELEGPPRELLRARDPSDGSTRVLDLADARVRAAHAERVAAWRIATERELRRAKVDRMDVPVPLVASAEAVAGPILSFFRMRELRGTKR